MKAIICERRQRSKGTWPNCGPDTYVAVQIVPEGVTPLYNLNSHIAEKRGIEIIYCGEGYSDRQKTSRSSLNQARERAAEIARKYEGAK